MNPLLATTRPQASAPPTWECVVEVDQCYREKASGVLFDVPSVRPMSRGDCHARGIAWPNAGKHKATGHAGTEGAAPNQEPVLHEWSDKICGFSAMDPDKRRSIASTGGKRAHELGVAYQWSGETAAAAGRKGGVSVSRDRGHMSNIGRRGGLVAARDPEHMARIGGLGGSSVSDGPRGRKHMSEIGKKGAAARAAKKSRGAS